MKNTNKTVAQVNGADRAPTAGKTRRPRRTAREPGVGHEPGSILTEPEKKAAPRSESKIARVIALLQREQGATLEELVHETGWLPHTTRAALTGLRKKGHTLEKTKRGDVTCYRIEGAA